MHAWILDESPGSYRWGEIDTPEPGPDEVRVAVRASALNHMDLWVTRGMPRPSLPHVPGCDVAGVVDAVGPGVTGWVPGDEVVINPSLSPLDDALRLGIDSPIEHLEIYGEHVWGGHARYAVAPARNIVRRPAGLEPPQDGGPHHAAVTIARRQVRQVGQDVGQRHAGYILPARVPHGVSDAAPRAGPGR